MLNRDQHHYNVQPSIQIFHLDHFHLLSLLQTNHSIEYYSQQKQPSIYHSQYLHYAIQHHFEYHEQLEHQALKVVHYNKCQCKQNQIITMVYSNYHLLYYQNRMFQQTSILNQYLLVLHHTIQLELDQHKNHQQEQQVEYQILQIHTI